MYGVASRCTHRAASNAGSARFVESRSAEQNPLQRTRTQASSVVGFTARRACLALTLAGRDREADRGQQWGCGNADQSTGPSNGSWPPIFSDESVRPMPSNSAAVSRSIVLSAYAHLSGRHGGPRGEGVSALHSSAHATRTEDRVTAVVPSIARAKPAIGDRRRAPLKKSSQSRRQAAVLWLTERVAPDLGGRPLSKSRGITPAIDRNYPLCESPKAVRYVATLEERSRSACDKTSAELVLKAAKHSDEGHT